MRTHRTADFPEAIRGREVVVLDVTRVEVRICAANEELQAGLVELERLKRPSSGGTRRWSLQATTGEEEQVVVQVKDRREGEPEEAVIRVRLELVRVLVDVECRTTDGPSSLRCLR